MGIENTIEPQTTVGLAPAGAVAGIAEAGPRLDSSMRRVNSSGGSVPWVASISGLSCVMILLARRNRLREGNGRSWTAVRTWQTQVGPRAMLMASTSRKRPVMHHHTTAAGASMASAMAASQHRTHRSPNGIPDFAVRRLANDDGLNVPEIKAPVALRESARGHLKQMVGGQVQPHMLNDPVARSRQAAVRVGVAGHGVNSGRPGHGDEKNDPPSHLQQPDPERQPRTNPCAGNQARRAEE